MLQNSAHSDSNFINIVIYKSLEVNPGVEAGFNYFQLMNYEVKLDNLT